MCLDEVKRFVSRIDEAAERRSMVAVGLSPRSGTEKASRRGATLESPPHRLFNRSSVATRRVTFIRANRGLKPTATISSSLCDELPAIIIEPCSSTKSATFFSRQQFRALAWKERE